MTGYRDNLDRRREGEARPAGAGSRLRNKPPAAAGFTLMELLIVVGILAVLAAVALPAARSQGNAALEAAGRTLAADLRLARSLALEQNTHWTVRFDSAENAYELVHTGSGDFPPPPNPLAPAGQTGDRYRVDFDALESTRPRGGYTVRLGGAALKDSRSLTEDVTFGPQGGTGPERNEDTLVWLTTGTGGDTRFVRLRISWVTGLIWVDRPAMFRGTEDGQLYGRDQT